LKAMFDPSLDARAFLGDFGVSVVWTDKIGTQVNALGILEEPNRDSSIGYAVTSVEYSVVYATAEMDIQDGDPLTVNGMKFVAKGNPNSEDEGTFSRLLLKRV
jgi:hypothetical protein